VNQFFSAKIGTIFGIGTPIRGHYKLFQNIGADYQSVRVFDYNFFLTKKRLKTTHEPTSKKFVAA
jgi:hypothetical protein